LEELSGEPTVQNAFGVPMEPYNPSLYNVAEDVFDFFRSEFILI
jgi:hypothetical protein